MTQQRTLMGTSWRLAILFLIGCFSYWNAAHAEEFVSKSERAGLRFVGQVVDGYKVKVHVYDTRTGTDIYSDSFESDVYSIHAEFVDLNKDGFADVFVKFEDESGFEPAVLVNKGNKSFVNALRGIKEPVYVETETGPPEDGKAGEWRFRKTEMRCTNTLIGKVAYREVTFRYDGQARSYALVEKKGPFRSWP